MYLTLQQMQAQFYENPNVRFREETVGGKSVTIVCYMLSDDSLWDVDLGVETRGPCFDTDTGMLLSLPFEKFFNVNEKAHTQAPRVGEIMSKCAPEVCTKMDGSMITPALIDGKVFLKTKKSFVSDVAIDAQKHMTAAVETFSREFLSVGYTPIFEYTSPDNKVVIDYGAEPTFTLLAVRHMFDGSYLLNSALDFYAKQFNVARPEWMYYHDLDALMHDCGAMTGIEGYVIYTPQGRFKLKTKWYIDRHRMIDIRERDIAEFVLDETLDDLIPNLLAAEVDMTRVREIEHEIVTELSAIRSECEALAKVAQAFPDGKMRAEWVKKNTGELQNFVFRASRGQEVSDDTFKVWYKSRYLSRFSLRSIGNPNFRTSDDA